MAKKPVDPKELAEIDEVYTRLTGLPADPPRRKNKGLRFLLLVLLACLAALALHFAGVIDIGFPGT